MSPPLSKLRIALVGAGAMGSFHARVVAQSQDAELVCVVDPDRDSGEALAERWRSKWVPELDSFRGIDGVIIASPTDTHVEWATRGDRRRYAGPRRKAHLRRHSAHRRAARTGEREGRTDDLRVCLERFNAALCTALEIVEEPVLVMTVRQSHHLSRITTGVSYDLLIHDVDLVLRMTGGLPESLTSHLGAVHPDSLLGAEDIAETTLRFDDGMLATLSANRISNARCARSSSTSSTASSKSTWCGRTSRCTATSKETSSTDRAGACASRR